MALPDFFFFDLLAEGLLDLEDLWELEDAVVDFVVAAAVPELTSNIETAVTASDWRIRRFKRKLGTSGEIYEFL